LTESSSEYSVSAPLPSSSGVPVPKRISHPRGVKSPLEKKGNERYGRFE